VYARSAQAARVTDVDGHELLDLNNNNTALIHGHASPPIVEAVSDQLKRGSAVSFGTETEIKLAELLSERVPTCERIRFSNSGTEAMMMAIRVARAYTGRPKVAKCEGSYHGTYDYSEMSYLPGPDEWGEGDPVAVPNAAGVPRGVIEDTVIIPFNDVEASERILSQHAGQLAAVCIDPVSEWVGIIPPTPEFLEMLRAFTRRHGIVFIFDEVVAFRLAYHGAQSVYNVRPDLTAFAKIIGGGFPVGAIGGGADIMSVFEGNFFAGDESLRPRISHGGTFNANITTMTAGLAAMEHWTPEAVDRLNALGEYARQQLRKAFESAGYPGQVTGVGSFIRMHLTRRPITGYRAAYWRPDERDWLFRLQGYMLNNGVFTQPHMSCLSTPMTEADINLVAEVVESGLRELVADGCVPAA
jgi:glutamate-1-semialdehyde 2,1-aminomutase